MSISIGLIGERKRLTMKSKVSLNPSPVHPYWIPSLPKCIFPFPYSRNMKWRQHIKKLHHITEYPKTWSILLKLIVYEVFFALDNFRSPVIYEKKKTRFPASCSTRWPPMRKSVAKLGRNKANINLSKRYVIVGELVVTFL